jgi:AraC-like DNA-binding protein
MEFDFEYLATDSPYIHTIWRTQSEHTGTMISQAGYLWEMVFTRLQGKTTVSIRGPETKASLAPVPPAEEFFGIAFQLGVFMPSLPVSKLVDTAIHVPESPNKTFWLHGAAREIPTYENADVFVDRLVREGLLTQDPIVGIALHGQVGPLSDRTVQRRFQRATGLTHGTISQIDRATYAAELLSQGVSILDTVEQAGYTDQPHLTRSLRRFIGRTPGEIVRAAASKAAANDALRSDSTASIAQPG